MGDGLSHDCCNTPYMLRAEFNFIITYSMCISSVRKVGVTEMLKLMSDKSAQLALTCVFISTELPRPIWNGD